MNMNNELVVRRAVLGDYDDVIAIRDDVYEGSDYLRDYYWLLMQDPHALSFVADHKGKIVGFHGFKVIDEGRVAVGIAARVSQSMAGKGVFSVLDKTAFKVLQQEWPSLRNIWWTAVYSKLYEENEGLAKTPWKIIAKWRGLKYKTEMPENVVELQKYFQRKDRQILLANDKTEQILCDTNNIRALFPEGTTVAFGNWFPLTPSRDNLRRIIQNHHTLVTYSNGRIVTISFGHVDKVEMGPSLCVYCYGDDEEDLCLHSFKQLMHFRETMLPGTRCTSFLAFPQHMDMSLVRRRLKPVLGESIDMGCLDDICIVVQMPLQVPQQNSRL